VVSPVDPSGTVARLTALLRRRAGGGGRPAAAASAADTPGEAEATLSERLRAVSRDHPRRGHAMARILVETLLTDEFGAQVMNEPAFQSTVDDVLQAMTASPALAADLARVTEALSAESSGPDL